MEKSINYISLKEAAKFCDYSQDYLKLRARQGKLRALKIGRNWVTTREWLQDYVNNVGEVPEPFRKARKKVVFGRNITKNKSNFKSVLVTGFLVVILGTFLLICAGKSLAEKTGSLREMIPAKTIQLEMD